VEHDQAEKLQSQASLEQGQDQTQDQAMMQRCLALAARALGQTAPNPLVGCVIVQGNEIVGEGFHPKAGEPHAEVFALRAAGERAKGSTLYVSLEPCNHYGRTPPCSEAIVAAQVARVVVGMIDPDPRVSGQGVARLQQAGIEVVTGCEEAACQKLNEGFVHRVRYQRPFGVLKYAMTLDGKIAASSGHSAWVTEPLARQHVHQLRSSCDAVIVGGNTVRVDNPQLTSHNHETRNPLRVVMSRSLDLPKTAHLWQTDAAATLVLTESPVPSSPNQGLLEAERQGMIGYLKAQGVAVVALEQLTPATAMAYLYQQGLANVLWECGGTLAAQAIAQGCVQKIWAFIAPKIIGGTHAPSPVGDLGLANMTEALHLRQVSWQAIGNDCLVEGYLPEVLP
jgi:diaminohydroxyphosphoribosylaminopyrimidine deaminase / 5-amino-6-(5-phosphoribosylamino)uracil reductase